MMVRRGPSPFLQMIRHVLDDPKTRAASDADLLRGVIAGADDSAFNALVRRHGPMVFDVCRAVLGNEADAEDAFQATFLVLARKARSIRKRGSLGSWLHGVAYRTALKAQALGARRRRLEAGRTTAPRGADDRTWGEIQRVLHEELDGLAECYRAPLLLCYLQGKTQDEAAQQLGIPPRRVKQFLERGRALLRARLARRGVGPTGVLIAFVWPAAAAAPAAAVPAHLASLTVQAGYVASTGMPVGALVSAEVAELSAAVLRTTLLAKVNGLVLVGAVLAVGVMGSMFLVQGPVAVHGAPLAASHATPARRNVGETLPVQADGPASRKDAPGVERAVNRFVEQLRKNPRRRFADGDTLGLYVMDLGKKDVTLIASEVDEQRAYCGSPQWSNDGRRILFDASPGQEWTKTRLQMLESTEQGLGLSSFGFGNCPTLSPDGSRIAFLLNEGAIAGAKQGLYVMNADGTGRRWLDGYGRPRFAPDGKHLLSVSFSNPAELSLIGTETAASRSLELPGHQFLSVPSWTAPHQLVSVVRAADRTISIALLAVKEPAEVKIEQVLWKRGDGATVEPLYPVYSAKTKRCIFVGREPQGQSLYAVEAGKRPERLEADRYDGKIASLALSPDGQCLLFASDRP